MYIVYIVQQYTVVTVHCVQQLNSTLYNVCNSTLYIVYSSLKLSKCTVMHLYFGMSIGAKTLLRREEGLVYTPYGQCISEEGSNVYFD